MTPALRSSWSDWTSASPALLAEFARDGVVRVEFVPGYWVWLGTTTDTERDALSATSDVRDRAQRALGDALPAELQGFRIESQETVDRDFEGSWFYRLR